MFRVLLTTSFLLSPLSASAIFYGEDDYIEVDRIPDSDSGVDWRRVARSVAILVPDPGPGEFDLSGVPAMQKRYRKPPLEPGYPYAEQPRLANLTAFLVAPDKIMTAGHAGVRQLRRAAFLFDYTWDSENRRLRKTTYEPGEIYRCKRILLHRNDGRGDYAICQLDRPVTGRTPLRLEVVENAMTVHNREARMISAPDGTPLKLTSRGRVLGKRPTRRSPDLKPTSFLFHTLDNSGGSSGAPILDAKTGRVIGIQSGGDDNFITVRGVVHATRGDFEASNLGRPLTGEWGSLIPPAATELLKTKPE